VTTARPPEETLRLFVALELPDTWKQALATLQDEMRHAVQQRFGNAVRPRWIRPDAIHLTLKFLGETPANRLEALTSALAAAVPDDPGLSLSLGRAGSFENRRAPRVILATVAGDTRPLLALAERIETWLAAAGWPREKRPFQPHLTLARLPDGMDDATRRAVAALTSSIQAPQTPPWRVDRVYLIRSHLGPGNVPAQPRNRPGRPFSGGPGVSPGLDTTGPGVSPGLDTTGPGVSPGLDIPGPGVSPGLPVSPRYERLAAFPA